MHYCVRLMFAENTVKLIEVANIDVLEGVALTTTDLCKRFEVASVGEFVEVDHGINCAADNVANHSRADETGSASDENFHFPKIL
jgi:hypothetical protein